MKTKITRERQEVLNLIRRTDKHSETSIELAAHTEILKQQKTIKWQESPHISQY
jgi:hypothetical protein